ncbi:MAG: helix-turn-helix domain-containing protein [Treponema sp.]|nr:helix-turn-helix domain-containing protein [Treponema sp.]
MMKIFVHNMKKYRKYRHISQMKLAEMLNTSTSYIGEIEINARVPSMEMVEKIAKALKIEPFRLFIDDINRKGYNLQESENPMENIETTVRQAMANEIKSRISNEVDKFLLPENEDTSV